MVISTADCETEREENGRGVISDSRSAVEAAVWNQLTDSLAHRVMRSAVTARERAMFGDRSSDLPAVSMGGHGLVLAPADSCTFEQAFPTLSPVGTGGTLGCTPDTDL